MGTGLRRALPRVVDQLEARWLLAAPALPGNVGQIVASQYQPSGFKTKVGMQLQDVVLNGRIKVDVVTPPFSAVAGTSAFAFPVNAGLIALSQFNNSGFRTVGIQLDRVALGGGLTVAGFDNEVPSPPFVAPVIRRTATTTNLVLNSQFNDGGFGTLERLPDGRYISYPGRVGIKWNNVAVKGTVGIGLDDNIIRPGAVAATPAIAGTAPAVSGVTPAVSSPGQKRIDLTTNTGQITNSQFNDGGFGDIGFQWSNVAVEGNVGTSTNTLFINPLQNNYGPITVQNQVFGASMAGAASPAGVAATAATDPPAGPGAVASAAAASPPFETTYTNSATNSGQIVGAQFNDGGFGDIGLQWKDVRVKGTVSAVHNSLTVQPKNVGQGLITVQGIRFPSVAAAPPPPAPGPLAPIPNDPALVANDGSLTAPLPAPTGPLSPFFPVPLNGPGVITLPFQGNFPLENAATNSGLIQGGQLNAGGFGDDGLQWRKVQVGGNVQVVHNSLSVHPEGSKLAGISVSDVSYGGPISQRISRTLAVLPYLVVSTGNDSAGAGASSKVGRILTPPNDRILTNQQLAAASGTDVFLQWNGIEHGRGLVLVHNIIKIMGVGPTTGPIILSNIRFPFRIPPTGPLVTVSAHPAAASSGARAAAAGVGFEPRVAVLLNASNNSGIAKQAQFSTGQFGDDGLQWNNVSVGGPVTVVHNTLAVDTTADLPTGDVSGSINISNIAFNSGALDAGVSGKQNQILISPPDILQRASTHPVNLGKALPQDPRVRQETTNSGILKGGQLSSGGANHTLLQWQCVRLGGKVTVIDNVLSISVIDRPSGPITISNVTFA
jgi:hypothetical protein